MRSLRRLIALPLLVAAGATAGCGEDGKRIANGRIIESLELKRTENGYAIRGDPFCAVKRGLLNDASEVEEAIDRDKIGLVIASGGGQVGVQGVPPFAPDCRRQAQRRLNRLDPRPRES